MMQPNFPSTAHGGGAAGTIPGMINTHQSAAATQYAIGPRYAMPTQQPYMFMVQPGFNQQGQFVQSSTGTPAAHNVDPHAGAALNQPHYMNMGSINYSAGYNQQFVGSQPTGPGQQYVTPINAHTPSAVQAYIGPAMMGGHSQYLMSSAGGVASQQQLIMPPLSNITSQQFIPSQPYMSVAPGYHPPVHSIDVAASGSDRLSEEERRKNEKELKKRQFVEQQRRLQAFASGTAGHTMNADSLIESILGSSADNVRRGTKETSPVSESSSALHAPISADSEDGFGEFHSVIPVTAKSNAVNQPTVLSVTSSSVGTCLDPGILIPPISSDSMNSTIAASSHTSQPQENKKDLMSMMMECSDLSTDKKGRGFIKKTAVNQVTISRPSSATVYSESKAACHWTDKTDALSELFTLPAPPVPSSHPTILDQPGSSNDPSLNLSKTSIPPSFIVVEGGEQMKLPRWVTGELPAPTLYQEILRNVTRDGLIDTSLVYPILLASGLPREVLGYIWDLCNKTTIGQLVTHELYLILAMIAIAQNHMSYTSLSILSRCPQAPIPNLSGHALQQQQPITTTHAPQAATTGQVPLVHTTEPAIQPPDYFNCVNSGVSLGLTADDAVESTLDVNIPPGSDAQDGWGSFQCMASPVASHANVKVECSHASGIPRVPQYNNSGVTVDQSRNCDARVLSNIDHSQSGISRKPEFAGHAAVSSNEDDFTDFLSSRPVTKGAGVMNGNISGLNREGIDLWSSAADDKYAVLREVTSTFADLSTVVIPAPSSTSLSSSDHLVSAPHYSNSSGFVADSIPSFTGVPGSSEPPAATSDKYSVLKSLVGDRSLFASVPVKRADTDSEDTDWAEFQTVPSASDLPGAESDNRKAEADSTNSQIVATDWSTFHFVQPSSTNSSTRLTNSSGTVNNADLSHSLSRNSELVRPSSNEKTETYSSATNRPEKHNFFAGRSNQPAAINISALDLHPPDFPPEEDNDDDFYEFTSYNPSILGNDRTRTSTESNRGKNNVVFGGISSLTANIDDDFDGLTSSHKINASDRSVTSETWKRRCHSGVTDGGMRLDDCLSMNSLDLQADLKVKGTRSESDSPHDDSLSGSNGDFVMVPHGGRESFGRDSGSVKSPMGDEQSSVRSLEVMSSTMKSPAHDVMSIASLELKADVGADDASRKSAHDDADAAVADEEPEDEQYGYWEQPVRPVNARDLLDQDTIGAFADRYSRLTDNIQDGERVSYDWHRCLEKCVTILRKACHVFARVSSSSVVAEVLATEHGITYITGVAEVYVVARRIAEEMKYVSISTAQIVELIKDIDQLWLDLSIIFSAGLNSSSPSPPTFLSLVTTPGGYSSLISAEACLKADDEGAREKACGLCLLNVDYAPSAKTTSSSSSQRAADSHFLHVQGNIGSSNQGNGQKLTYGGRQYHASCANFWINCVDPTLPMLHIPELL